MESRERNSINYSNNPPQSDQDSSPRLNIRRNKTLNHLIFKLHTEKLEPQRSTKKQPPSQQPPPSTTVTPVIRYRECLKNHAANMGTHVLDGCGEFMPSGEDETLEALKCAACACHRSFHRREVEGESLYSSHHIHHMAPPLPPRAAAVHLPPAPSTQQQPYHHRLKPPVMVAFGGSNGAAGESSSEEFNVFQLMKRTSKKRFRTQFTQEQKDKMLDFAERIEWKIKKQNEEDVLRFCNEVGLKKKVFKVWMHNNRQVAKKK